MKYKNKIALLLALNMVLLPGCNKDNKSNDIIKNDNKAEETSFDKKTIVLHD